MADFFSRRFGKNVWIANHAKRGMERRKVDDGIIESIVEHGEIGRKDDVNMWIFMHVEERADNLICVAAVNSEAVIIKTVMINRQLEDEP